MSPDRSPGDTVWYGRIPIPYWGHPLPTIIHKVTPLSEGFCIVSWSWGKKSPFSEAGWRSSIIHMETARAISTIKGYHLRGKNMSG